MGKDGNEWRERRGGMEGKAGMNGEKGVNREREEARGYEKAARRNWFGGRLVAFVPSIPLAIDPLWEEKGDWTAWSSDHRELLLYFTMTFWTEVLPLTSVVLTMLMPRCRLLT